ncbi:unnamed protein product [Mytilus edulis]|uniref:Ig-like domain-containing protein n=1 Tax=Mytilus edulis TaxID=6550 RepID=A0A8S3V3R7_MYTED|nr:unnamed protein product [Mytilus edulis]
MFASYWWLRNSSFISNSAIFDIARVKWSDTGMYRCQANNSVGLSELSTAINLKVMYDLEDIYYVFKGLVNYHISISPDVQLDKLDEIKLNEGTRLFVSCNGHSYPEFSENHVIWTNNNNTFNRPRRDLVIDNVNRNDSGTYKCSVTLKVKPTIGESVDIIGTTTVHVNILCKY